MAKFKIVTPEGASFTVAGGGYDYEMEALAGMDAEIVECPATEEGFIAGAQNQFVHDRMRTFAIGPVVH